MRRRRCAWGPVIIAFGLGIILECCFPSSFIVFIIAVIIIIAGAIICKC